MDETSLMGETTEGVIHGRFQPLHLGHLEYLLEGKKRCKRLWVGLSNPDLTPRVYQPTSPHRSLLSANPFTYLERFRMVRDSMLDAGIRHDEFEIIPFPIDFPEELWRYAPIHARFFLTIYDDWGRKKIDMFDSIGVRDLDIMWERLPSEKITTGTEVRHLIETGQKWDHLIPNAVIRIIHEIGLDTLKKRLRSVQ